MTLYTDSIYGHSEPFGWYTYAGPFVSAGLGVADAIWGEQLYDWIDDNF